jgi:voltage-gated potassium channel
MPGQTVIIGFGVTGISAAHFLLRAGVNPTDLVVVDQRADALDEATALELSGHLGDVTDHTTLARTIPEHSRCVIVAVQPDETAVMTTMAARNLCPQAVIVTAVHDDDNTDHARRGGANQVITTSHWAGRALAMVLD